MQVAVTESAVREFVRELFEPQGKEAAPAVVVEPPVQELPVEPNPEIGTEGVFELPPVEDPEFSPGTPSELAKAAYAVGKNIPSNNIEQFWKALDRLADEAATWSEDEAMMSKKVEENLRRQIRKYIREARNESRRGADSASRPDPKSLGVYGKDLIGGAPSWDSPDTRWTDPDEEEDWETMPDIPDTAPGQRGHETSWEDIANMTGFASASGAKQFSDDPGRLMDRARFLFKMMNDDPAKFDTMISDAVGAYADALLADDLIDQEDAEYLKAHPEHTQQLESFRVFLKKFVVKLMKKDPDIQAHIQGRKDQAAAQRAANKKRRAAKKASKDK